MRARFGLVLALVLLAGCATLPDGLKPAGPKADASATATQAETPAPTEPAPDDTRPPDGDPAPLAAVAQTPEAAASAEPVPAPPKPRDPNLAARADCVAKGGSFSRTKTGAFVCVTRTRDFKKSCTASSQCEGSCLARSGTCSPVTPLIGCHEIVTERGRMATVCID